MFEGAGVGDKYYTTALDCWSFSHVLLEEGSRGETEGIVATSLSLVSCWRPTCIGITNLGPCEEKHITFRVSKALDGSGETMFLSFAVRTRQPTEAEEDTPSGNLEGMKKKND